GSASLHWCEQEPTESDGSRLKNLSDRPSLSILYQDPVGFHFGYSTGKGAGVLVPFDPSLPDDRILHYLCGSRAFFPAATFVPPQVAERIVSEFIKTGKPSATVTWKSGGQLRCGDPEN